MNREPLIDITTTLRILGWIRQAGQIALRHFQQTTPSTKPDNTLVTQADVEIERYLTRQITAQYPQHNLLTEEGLYRQTNATSPYTWVLDPLDGTTAFVRGLPTWGVALALLEAGNPIWGAFYMPLLDDMTYTMENSVHCTRCATPRLCTRWERHGFVATSMTAHTAFHIGVPRVGATGSIGANLVYTARGTATAAFIPKAYVWDLAVGAAILSRMGGELRYLSGKPVDYRHLLDGRRAPEPVIAGHPRVVQCLHNAITPLEAHYAQN